MEKETFLSPEKMNYFVRIKRNLDRLKPGMMESEELDIMKSRILEEIDSVEYKCAMNPVASRVIEKLLIYMKSDELIKLFISLSKHIPELSLDKFGSHVVQKILTFLSLIIESPENSQHLDEVICIIKKMVKISEQLFLHIYGKHVARSLIEFIGHICVNQRIKFDNSQDTYCKPDLLTNRTSFFSVSAQKFDVQLYCKLMKRIVKRFKKVSVDLSPLTNKDVSITYSYIILSSYNIDKNLFNSQFNYLYHMIRILFSESTFNHSILGEDPSSTFLVQMMFVFADKPEVREFLFDRIITPFIGSILTNSVSNNAILSFIRSSSSFEEIKRVSECILKFIGQSKFPTLLNLSVLSCILEKCVDLGRFDRELSKSILACFDCNDFLFSRIITHNPGCNNVLESNINPSSCYFLSYLFSLGVCKPILSSFVSLPIKELHRIATDPSGSRVFDAFFKSSKIPYRRKEKFLNSIENDDIIKLSKNKYSSFCVENLWPYLSDQRRGYISSIINKSSQYKTNQFGKNLTRKLNLDCSINSDSSKRQKCSR